MSTRNGQRVAMVLSGGGANGAYEVGVLKALLSGKSRATDFQPLDPDIITGTSIGALNAAFLVSQWDEHGPATSAGHLERFWLQEMAGSVRNNGVFRLRGNPLELLDPECYVPNPLYPFLRLAADSGFLAWESLQRLVNLLRQPRVGSNLERLLLQLVDMSLFIDLSPFEGTLRKLDYSAIQQSRKKLKVAATNWATGELRVFQNRDMTDELGPIALRASAAVPGIFPPAEFGAQPFVDGSVLLNTPLSLAINAGADVLHVIYLDPKVINIPLARIPQSFSTMQRMFQISWANAYNANIAAADRINRTLAALETARSKLKLDDAAVELLQEVAQVRPPDREPLRRLTIHRYHPRDPLPGELSFLNFDSPRIESLIERGYQDAIYHDDQESEDVFPHLEVAQDQSRRFKPRLAAV